MKEKILKCLKDIPVFVLSIWVLMGSFPTSWIYDLWAGTGSEQGQRIGAQVEFLTSRDQIEELYFSDTPVTVPGRELVKCPLMGMRDPDMAGEHRGRGGRTWSIPQYMFLMGFPEPVRTVLKHLLFNGFYNTYYLAELEDGSYVGVFFDDYVMLLKPFQEELTLPAGRVRYASSEEKIMLREMEGEYDVELAYVVDMYNYEKAHWIADFAVRLLAVFVAILIGITIQEKFKRWQKQRAGSRE